MTPVDRVRDPQVMPQRPPLVEQGANTNTAKWQPRQLGEHPTSACGAHGALVLEASDRVCDLGVEVLRNRYALRGSLPAGALTGGLDEHLPGFP